MKSFLDWFYDFFFSVVFVSYAGKTKLEREIFKRDGVSHVIFLLFVK